MSGTEDVFKLIYRAVHLVIDYRMLTAHLEVAPVVVTALGGQSKTLVPRNLFCELHLTDGASDCLAPGAGGRTLQNKLL